MEQFANGTPAGQLGDVEWRKASKSWEDVRTNCVEVTPLSDGQVGVRNSRDKQGPALVYTRREIAAFIAGAKAGEFDDLTV